MTQAVVNKDKVAVYIRWSTDDQSEGTTLETQLDRCKSFLVLKGWSFNEALLYIDDGYSGATLDRPDLSRLRGDVDSGLVDCVVVYKIDRLSRSVADIAYLVTKDWEGRCHVQSASESIDTTSPAGKMFFYNLASFAEYERGVIKERTMGGKIKRAQQGSNPGFRPPFGYTKGSKPGEMVVVDHEASLVRRIFELYRTGLGGYQIAHTLNREGITRRGSTWTELTIRRILRNPSYIGVLEYGRTARTPQEQRGRQGVKSEIRYDKPRYAVVENALPRIIDDHTWNEVHGLLTERSLKHKEHAIKPTYSDYLLSGIAVCVCGAPINGKKVGRGHYYYYCSARKRRGSSVCDAGHMPVLEVNAEIETRLKALLSDEGKATVLRAYDSGVHDRIQQVEGALRQAESDLLLLDDHEKRLQRDYRAGELSARLYEKEIVGVEAERTQAANRITTLQAKLAELKGMLTDRKTLLAALESISAWDDQTIPERKHLLQKLASSIVLYRKAHSDEQPLLEVDWVKLT
jgi:site-specific DNA recombinase